MFVELDLVRMADGRLGVRYDCNVEMEAWDITDIYTGESIYSHRMHFDANAKYDGPEYDGVPYTADSLRRIILRFGPQLRHGKYVLASTIEGSSKPEYLAIHQSLEVLKEQFGLTHYPGRGWKWSPIWNGPIVLGSDDPEQIEHNRAVMDAIQNVRT